MWVDNMVDNFNTSYLYQKRGVYYFSKQVPSDVRQHYKRDRIVICLKTKSVSRAKRMCESILQRLHDYWLSLRLSATPLPAQHLVRDSNGHGQLSSGPTLLEARDAYIKLKGVGKDKTFIRGASRNVDAVIKQLGDRPIDGYSSSDAAALAVYQIVAEGRAAAVWSQMAETIEDSFISKSYAKIAKDEGFHSTIGEMKLEAIATTPEVQAHVLELVDGMRKDLFDVSCANTVEAAGSRDLVNAAYGW